MLDKLLKQAEAIQKSAVAYVEKTQPIVEEYANFKSGFAKRAHEVVGALVERNIVSRDASSELIEKLASEPTYALDLALAVSRRIGVGADLGKSAGALPAAGNLDPFEKLVLFGDSRADVSNFDGGVAV
jgi:hypothetical protein